MLQCLPIALSTQPAAAKRQYVTKMNPDRSNLIKFSYSSDIYFPYVVIRTLASFESEKPLLIWYF